MKIRSEKINEVSAALAIAQGQMEPAKMDGEVSFKNRKFKYATLSSVWDSIRKPFSDNGLSVTQMPEEEEGRFKLVTILLHSSGQYLGNEIPLNTNGSMQDLGGELTYARRYGLSALGGIVSDEDKDAEGLRNDKPVQAQNGQQPATKDGKPILTAEQTRDLYIKRLRALETELNAFEKEAGNTETELLEDWLKKAPFDDLEAKGKDMKASLEQWRFLEEQKKAEIETEDEIPF